MAHTGYVTAQMLKLASSWNKGEGTETTGSRSAESESHGLVCEAAPSFEQVRGEMTGPRPLRHCRFASPAGKHAPPRVCAPPGLPAPKASHSCPGLFWLILRSFSSQGCDSEPWRHRTGMFTREFS